MSDDEERNPERGSEAPMNNNSCEKNEAVQAEWFTRAFEVEVEKTSTSIEEAAYEFQQSANDGPYCALPNNFFAFALRDKRDKGTRLLTIDSWDGREILSVLRRQ